MQEVQLGVLRYCRSVTCQQVTYNNLLGRYRKTLLTFINIKAANLWEHMSLCVLCVWPLKRVSSLPFHLSIFITWPLRGGSLSQIIPLGLLLLPHLYDGALLHGGGLQHLHLHGACLWHLALWRPCLLPYLFGGTLLHGGGLQHLHLHSACLWRPCLLPVVFWFRWVTGCEVQRDCLFLRIFRNPLASGVLCPTCAS